MLTRYADDAVIVSRTYRQACIALKVVQAIMKRLELQLHPGKTRIVHLGGGKEGFDFLGLHHRRIKVKSRQGREFYTTVRWPSKKAMKKMRQRIKTLLEPGGVLSWKPEWLVAELNPIIRGWRNYYSLPYNWRRLNQIDYYILVRLTIWYNRKQQKKDKFQRQGEAYQLFKKLGLERVADYRKLQEEGHRKAG